MLGRMDRTGRSTLLLGVLLLAAGCASVTARELRTTQGPTAQEMWVYRVASETGRAPTFEERQHWEDDLERRVDRFLAEHPEIANTFEVGVFRNVRQVTVGMTREQVLILLGAPLVVTTDAAKMEELARKFWPAIRDRAGEAWVYPIGWRLYFAGPKVIDITQYVQPF